MAHFKLRQCKNPDCSKEFQQYNSLQSYCSAACQIAHKKPKKIKQVSDKRKAENEAYSLLRKVFLNKPENKICPISKQPTVEVHHTYCGKDRAKYYLDVSTWLAVSRDGHNWIHDNPKEARELGYLK